MKSPTTIPHCVASFSDRTSEFPALKFKEDGNWISWSWAEYYSRISSIAHGLHLLGVRPSMTVSIMSNTRWEWAALDHAILGLGAWVVPIYQSVTAEDLEYILKNSESEFLILENRSLLRLYLSISQNCPNIKKVICIDPIRETDFDFVSWLDLLKLGESSPFEDQFRKKCLEIKPSDTATVLYTSGTTGSPKGVVLLHEAAFVEVSEAFPSCGARTDDVSLTFLPYAHVLGRLEHWGHAYIGFTIAFAESLDRVRSNLQEIRPTFMISVPRIFEKIYIAIQGQMDSQFITRKLSQWAVGIGLKVGEYKIRRAALPLLLALEYELARNTILSKVKDAFGGRLRFAISGGAPLSRDIALFFHACDILILEGYGLTETTGAITVNTPYDYHFGSVGKPIGEAKVKIAEDGELLIKSKKVMKEYFKDKASTQQVFTDGWFHTGDIGEINENGDIEITDRKKDLIKTAGGKYVAPQRLEAILKTHPLISNVLIHGDQRKYIVALITLDKNYLLNWAKQNSIHYSDYDDLTQSSATQDLVRKAVAESNSHLAGFESIKRFAILPSDFTVEGGELTPSLKVKRKMLDKKWSEKINSLYS
jgi:long-chain acyl-CoA synthetase